MDPHQTSVRGLSRGGERGICTVPREAVRTWCEENGLYKTRFFDDILSAKKRPWFNDYPYSPQKRFLRADKSGKRMSLKKPWYLRTPKRGWAWLIRPLQFIRERWVAFAAVAVIACWALILYSWTLTWLK